MKRRHLAAALASFALLPDLHATDPVTLSIESPKEGAQVDHRQELTGKVSNRDADVWVVIRPLEASEFWVQPPVTVKNDGSWKVIAYFGEAGRSQGKKFEVRAFANPVDKLSEGKKMQQWPKAAGRSDVIEVTRK